MGPQESAKSNPRHRTIIIALLGIYAEVEVPVLGFVIASPPRYNATYKTRPNKSVPFFITNEQREDVPDSSAERRHLRSGLRCSLCDSVASQLFT